MQYIIDNTTKEIFKYSKSNNYWIKVSPWKPQEDRRKFNCDGCSELNSKDATQMLNKVFDLISSTWDNYSVYSNFDEIDYADVPYHYWQFDDKIYRFRIIWHQGRLYWAQFGKYMPRIQLYNFYNDSTPPPFDKGPVKLTNFRHCKPVWDMKNKKFI